MSKVEMKSLIFTVTLLAIVANSKARRPVRSFRSDEEGQRAVSKYLCSGGCDVERERCSCKNTCKTDKNCCTDYEESCNGGQSWRDTECSTDEEMQCPDGYENPAPLVILSIDGYRDIYFHRKYTPTITKLATCGVSGPFMRSAYPTKTFPNHYTIVTGLYPESHGIIANTFYNHDIEEQFRLGREASFQPHWWRGEPIWVTTSKSGLKSGAYFWPGSDVNITRYPDYYYRYNESVDNEERVYQVLDWLDMPPEDRPSFIAFYMSIVDSAGHYDGPFGSVINPALEAADRIVEMFMNGLRDRGLDTCVNFIITSDHGMASIDCENNVKYIENYGINMSEVYFDGGPYGRVGKSTDKSLWDKFSVSETMKKLECKREETHWEAYLKYEYLPKRFHYANNPWIEDVHLVADDEWWIRGSVADGPDCSPGGHGYDNAYSDMRAFFTCHGSSFKRGYNRSLPVENIEIYNLMTELLGLESAPNNGTQGGINDVLLDSRAIEEEGAGVGALVCKYPTQSNIPANDLGCTGCSGVSQNDANSLLDLSNTEITTYNSKNMLYGTPKIFTEDAEYCVLTQKDYVTTYDQRLKMPLISSFVLDKTDDNDVAETTKCARKDIRVSEASTTPCSVYQDEDPITWSFLYSPDLSDIKEKTDATISSNMIPTYQPFASIWDFLTKSLRNWANLYNGITVDAGPIFDYNFDGLADSIDVIKANGSFIEEGDVTSTPVPTHFFIIMTRCRDYLSSEDIRDCSRSLDDIDVLSFIIPNYRKSPCHQEGASMNQWLPGALSVHLARIKDIELLTGISFFSKWMKKTENGSQESLQTAIRTKLVLPEYTDSWLLDFLSNATPPPMYVETTTSATPPIIFSSSVFALSILAAQFLRRIY